MSTTLKLVDHLLTRGRSFQQLGRSHDALQVFNRLAALRDLPPQVNEETLSRLAEILLGEGRYVKARRHLTALLVQCPKTARYHYLMASALEADERANPQRAADHYRRSLALDPNQPRCLGEYGLLALRLGQSEEGLAKLRQAVQLAPGNPEVLGRLVEGLRQLGRDDEARNALRAALFANARDRRFRELWNDFQFRILHEEQKRKRRGEPAQPPAKHPDVLPFVAPAAERIGEKVIRRDPPSLPQPPHVPQPGRVRGKKHA
jgi:tetratricopeptide (TPR) repeat protein